MTIDSRPENAAFVGMERAARQARARALEALRARRPREGATTAMTVDLGRRDWVFARRRLSALRRLRGRGR